MKVKKQAGKKVPQAPAQVQDFVQRAVAAAEPNILCNLLEEVCKVSEVPGISTFPFPKSDLFHWVPLLDHFDESMANITEKYWDSSTKLQSSAFGRESELLLCNMLHMTRLLLENCSSRNIYTSYDRLKRLLSTDSMALLEKVLELLLIPGRKLDSQASLRNTFEKEIGTDEVAILSQLSLPFLPEMGELEEAKFALRFRDHHIQRLPSLNNAQPERMQYIKMLSTAIFLMAQPEGAIDSAFFALSPTLVADTAKLITPTPVWPMKVEVAALSILRSCIRANTKWNDILHYLNIGVSHGPIISIFRTIVDRMEASEEPPYSAMFIHSYLDVVNTLSLQDELGDHFSNSGVVPESLRAIAVIHSKYHKIMEKTIYILDALLHNFTSALDLFFSSNGLLVVVRQITQFIDSAIMSLDSEPSEPPMTSTEAILLQCLLRFVDKLLGTNGSDDRLRNLLEGTLFKSLKAILDNSASFSAEIVTHSINITSSFIHNEPTSLSVLQESGVPQSLIICLKNKVPSTAEAISKLPYAYSATCLNAIGVEFFGSNDPVKSLCRIFLDVESLKVLRSRSTSTSLGTSMDEFIRHHPQSREMVLNDIVELLDNVPAWITDLYDNSPNRELFSGCDLPRDGTIEIPSVPEKRHEPILSQFLETFCGFIEGCCQTQTHAKQFLAFNGLVKILKVLFTPGVPFDFTVYNESISVSHLLHLLSDNDPFEMIKATSSALMEFQSSSDGETLLKRQISNLSLVGLLRDLYVTQSFSLSRVSGPVLEAFDKPEGSSLLKFLFSNLSSSLLKFSNTLGNLSDQDLASVIMRAKSDLKGPIQVTFISALSLSPRGKDLALEGDARLAEVAGDLANASIAKITMIDLFVNHRMVTNISALLGGFCRMTAHRGLAFSTSVPEVLIDGILALYKYDHTVHSSFESICAEVTQKMMISAVLFLDETGSKCSVLGSVLAKFFQKGGIDIFAAYVQHFTIEGLAHDVISDAFRGAILEVLSFFTKFLDPKVKYPEESFRFYRFADLITSYVKELWAIPAPVRISLGKKVIAQLLQLCSNLVDTSRRHEEEDSIDVKYLNSHLREIHQFVQNNLRSFTTEILHNIPELVLDVAYLARHALVDPDDEDVGESKEANEKESVEKVKEFVSWIISEECLVPAEVKLRILAVLVTDKDPRFAYVTLINHLPSFIELLHGAIKSVDHKLCASTLLICSQLVFLSSIPMVNPLGGDSVIEGKPSNEVVQRLAEVCLAMLADKIVALDRDFSLLHCISSLTRVEGALSMIDHGEISNLLANRATECLDVSDRRYRSLAIMSMFIIRHVIETPQYLKVLFDFEISNNSVTTLGLRKSYESLFKTSGFQYLYSRSANAFTENFEKYFEFDSNMKLTEHFYASVKPKKFDVKSKIEAGKNADSNPSTQTQIASSTSSLQSVDMQKPTLVDLEDLSLSPHSKDIIENIMLTIMSLTTFPSTESAEENQESEKDPIILSSHFKRCFLIATLVELIHCYPVCRVALLQSPKLTDFLTFALDKMTPSGELAGTLGSRVFISEPHMVSQFLEEITVGPSQASLEQKLPSLPDTVKLCVDSLYSAFRRYSNEVGPAINSYAKISRTWCLVMTVYVYLNVKEANSNRVMSPVQSAIAARMLEKGMIPTLTSILKLIDGKAPMAPMVSAKIIFSLETLTRIGNRLGSMASGQGHSTAAMDFDDEDDIGDSDGDSDDISENTDDIDSDEDDSDDLEQDMGNEMLIDVEMHGGDDEDITDDSEGTDMSTDYDEDESGEEDFDSDDYTDEDGDQFEFVVRPPVMGRNGPAAEALESGYQVIPVIDELNGSAESNIRTAFRGEPLDVLVEDFEPMRHIPYDPVTMALEDDEGDFTDEDMYDDEDGFSVGEEDFDDDGAPVIGDISGARSSLRTFLAQSRRGFNSVANSQRVDIRNRSFASQVREAEVYGHPIISREGPLMKSIPFDSQGRPITKKEDIPTWHENQDVFHVTRPTASIKRYTQENKLYLGEGLVKLAEDVMPLVYKETFERIEEVQGEKLDELAEKENPKTETMEESFTLAGLSNAEDTDNSEEERDEEGAPEVAEETTPVEPFVDNGPDRDFLMALPFDMRREVLEQYFEERRINVPDGSEITIDPEFLNSLPQDLRDDYQRLSQIECDRYRRRMRGLAGNGSQIIELGADADLQEFLNNIGVQLLQGNVTADINAPRGRRPNADQIAQLVSALTESVGRLRETPSTGPQSSSVPSVVPDNSSSAMSIPIAKKDYSNIIDVSSLSIILRAYYDPVMTDHRIHMRLFQHICQGSITRADLLNMLIYVLEEMPEDNQQLDMVLETYVSLNGPSQSKSKSGTPKATPRKKSPMPKSDPVGGASYVVIQQRTLQILMQLAQHNNDVKQFFTSECQQAWRIKKFDKKAEKGSKPTVMTTKYPIVLLLGSLDRSAFVQVPLLVEYLLHLLQLVSQPMKDSKDPSASRPEIPAVYIASLVRAVIQVELSPKSFQYATHVFQAICTLANVSETIMKDLAGMSVSLSEELVAELERFISVLKQNDKMTITEWLKEVSSPSSRQSRLLRCMRILSNTIMTPVKNSDEVSTAFDALIEVGEIKRDWSLLKQSNSKPCWKKLLEAIDSCLTSLDVDGDFYHVATGLLPSIEACFWKVRQNIVLSPESRLTEEDVIVSFAEKHRLVLNEMIRSNPSLLTSGAFVMLIRVPRVLDFDNKRGWFRQQVHKKGASRPSLAIHVRRSHLFEDSFVAIMSRSGEEVKFGRLSIKFHDEDGIDAGGVTREWFAVLSRQMFDPNYALFKVSAVDKITYQPNRMSYINPDHLQYFTFVGRIIGKAIYDNRLLDCYFTRAFYKHILRIPVDSKDMEAVDPEFYKSLVWILENDITDVIDLTFSVESEEFGVQKVIDLKPDGRNIAATETNKRDYVRLVTEYKLTTAVKPQIDAFLRGFNDIIPHNYISIFNEQELELLISGMPDIDVDDWKNNTEYTGYTVASPQIHWFWRLVRSFDQEYRAKLLQFVTGTSKVPLDGFANLQGSSGVQKFQIHRDYGSKERLPSAHTCFNQLDLPEYDSYEVLKEMLLKVINECGTGFGLA